uniref:Uncharacterized protein n=1 Tax=Myoviridae sp. ctQf419 TaxID=2825102 RepID=A0A8S5UKR8_9CAUD|nr:MAG TPA: hypothetical protein [Myoviridae sp. ctQf419]
MFYFPYPHPFLYRFGNYIIRYHFGNCKPFFTFLV